MTLEEAIQYAKEAAEINRKKAVDYKNTISGLEDIAEEYQQQAEWLEELKDYRDDRITCEFCKHVNKAENEFPCSICKYNHPSKFEPREEAKHG